MTLGSGSGYSVGLPASGNGTIADNDAPPVVTMTASDANGAEDGTDPITFTITRTNTFNPITVNLTVSGTATPVGDYTVSGGTLSGTTLQVTFAAGQATATVTMTPIDDNVVEGTETVVLTLANGTGYSIGTPKTATGSIVDNDVSIVSVDATDANGAEQGQDPIVFTVTRSAITTAQIVVALTWGGTAKYGTDYLVTVSAGGTLGGTGGTTLTIAANTLSVTLTLTPVDDTTVESTETAILTLGAGTGYSVGSPSQRDGLDRRQRRGSGCDGRGDGRERRRAGSGSARLHRHPHELVQADRRQPGLRRDRDVRDRLHGDERHRRRHAERHPAHAAGRRRHGDPHADARRRPDVRADGDRDAHRRRRVPATRSGIPRARAARSPTTTPRSSL